MKHLIIDGNNIANISFYRAKTIIQNDKPEEEEKLLCNLGIDVFLNIFHMYLKDNKDYKIYLTWDSRTGSQWRKQLLGEYKGNRDHSAIKNHDIIYDMMSELKNLFLSYPIYQIEVDNAEADDVIYNLCNILSDSKKIISSDGDMLQLPQKFNDVKIWNPRTKKYSDPPEYDVVTYKCICGDTSDSIEGLYKYGPKKTLKVMEEGLSSLTDEQKKIVENNRVIVDLAMNPSALNNEKKIQDIINNYSFNYDFNKIQKSFINLKQKQHFSNADQIKKILDQVNKNYD